MADKDKLQSIHDGLADWALAALAARDPDSGRPCLTASEAAVIAKFLKDNDITAPPVQGSKIMALREKLEAQRRIPAVSPALDGLGDGLMQ